MYVTGDRIRETTTNTGTGNITLVGAVAGFRAFQAVAATSDTFPYAIVMQDGSEWETGVGTLLTATSFSRSVIASSNANALVNFSSGVKDVLLSQGAAAPYRVTNTTASTSTSTGSLTVAGGVGITGALYVGGSTNLAADPTSDLHATTRRYAEATSGYRNRIINGDMRIDQRFGGGATTPASTGSYVIDRMAYYGTQASKMTFQRITSTLAGYAHSLRATTASTVSPGAADLFLLYQNIEGFNVDDLLWGTAGALPLGISFRAKASTGGTYCVAVRNSDGSRSHVRTVSLTAGTDTLVKMIFPGDTSGTWLKTNGVGISLTIDLGSGTNYNATVNTWTAGNRTRISGAVSLVTLGAATLEITGLQAEKLLSTAAQQTPFERRSYGTELALCQRYYCQIPISARFLATAATQYSSVSYQFPVAMRAAPSGVQFAAPVSANATNISISTTHPGGGRFDITSIAAGDAYCLDGVFAFEAEL